MKPDKERQRGVGRVKRKGQRHSVWRRASGVSAHAGRLGAGTRGTPGAPHLRHQYTRINSVQAATTAARIRLSCGAEQVGTTRSELSRDVGAGQQEPSSWAKLSGAETSGNQPACNQ
jgi:hypothetical protein